MFALALNQQVRLVRLAQRSGLVVARLRGSAEATAEIFVVLDRCVAAYPPDHAMPLSVWLSWVHGPSIPAAELRCLTLPDTAVTLKCSLDGLNPFLPG